MSQPNYISGLTPLRGIAAFFVIALHYQLVIAGLYPRGATAINENLYLMVDLFFVLSGFIMYHVYGGYFKEGITSKAYFSFMKARFARIYPLHLFMLLFTIGVFLVYILNKVPLAGFSNILFDKTAVPSQLVLLQAMGTHHEATWNSPSWSISVEWWAYVLFPFVLLFLVRTKTWSRLLVAAFIIGGYLLITFYTQPLFWAKRWEMMNIPAEVPYPMHTLDVITGPSAFLRCLCGFMGGMLVYEAFKKGRGSQWLKSGFVFAGIWVLLFTAWHFNNMPHYLSPVLFALLILSAAYNRGRLSRVLNSRGGQYVGDISYSVYLVHMPLLFLYVALRKVFVPNDPREAVPFGYTFTLTEAWLGFAAFVAVTLVLSSFTYHFIEKPARQYLNKGKRPAPVTQAAAVSEVETKKASVDVLIRKDERGVTK